MKFAKISVIAMLALGIVGCDNDNDNVSPPTATPTFNLQVLHASADAPAVNVVFGGEQVLSDVDYKSGSGQARIKQGTYSVQVDGNLPSGPATVIGPVDVAFSADTIYTIAAVGKVAEQTLDAGAFYDVLAVGTINPLTIEPLVAADDYRRIATAVKVRLIHASPAARDVDIYITAPGVSIDEVDPTLPGVPFKGSTGFLELDAGSYVVTITPAGTKTAAIGPLEISIDASGIYTAIARDAVGGGAPLSVILLDDFLL